MSFTIIAHRGASGYLPEHTLESVAMAHSWGVDFIEPDVVLTKDKELIVLHDIYIDTVTDVKEVFPKRARKDGRYYAIDFTLAEIKRLNAHERVNLKTGKAYFPKRFPHELKHFKVPTLVEFIEVLQGLNKSTGRSIGIYVEFKAPKFHEDHGHDIGTELIKVLHQYGYDKKPELAFIQCFDPVYLKKIHKSAQTKIPLIQLIADNSWKESSADYTKMMTAEGMDEVKKYADGIGPWLPQVATLAGSEIKPTDLMKLAHDRKLKVHAYTLRADQLPGTQLTFEQTLEQLIKSVKLDGIFTDFGDRALKVRDGAK
jgi:glycerophosphoryl diester phosphodiesterase